MTTKNTVPSAPEDMIESGQVFADDGRKRQDAEFVGAKNPDTDAASEEPRAQPLRGRSARQGSASRK